MKTKKEIIKMLLEQSEEEIVVQELKENYLQRQVITNGKAAEYELGKTQATIKELKNWVTFLKEK